MKKFLLALAMVALSGAFAHADDKGTEFKFGGDIRTRFSYDGNPTLAGSGDGTSENNILQREQLHLNAISGDRLQAYFNLIHYSLWGQAGSVPTNPLGYAMGDGGGAGTAGLGNANYNTNAVQINEAWFWWKINDMISLRAGRQGLEFGDGLVISRNDWTATPFSVDAVMLHGSWDWLDADLGAGKMGDLGLSSMPATGPASTAVAYGDTEVNFYGLQLSVKNLPDFLKKVDVFAILVTGDAGTAPATGLFMPDYAINGAGGSGAYNLASYGLHAKGDIAHVDYRADAVFQSGTQTASVSRGSDVTYNGYMYDLEVGYNFPEFMKARVYANWHQDSGDTNGGVGGTDSAYQPLFYDRHTYGGLMDFFGFGNLTDIRIGANGSPLEDTTVGVEVNLLSRTTTSGAYYGEVPAGLSNMFSVTPYNAANPMANPNSSSNLGTEVDVYATHDYGHGFSMLGQVGFLSLGDYFNYVSPNPGSAWQFVAQAKYAF